MSNQYGTTTVYNGRDFSLHDVSYNIDEIIQYYIIENHSKVETSAHFGINEATLTRIFHYYGVKKPKLLSYEHNRKTNLLKYGDPNYNNPEKYKQTNLEKYGVDNIFKDVQKVREAYLAKFRVSNPNKLEWVIKKREQTNLQRYGAKSGAQTKEIKEKVRQTNIERYGVPYQMMRPEVKAKYDFKTNSEKAFQTKLKNGTTNISKPEQDLEQFF